MPFFICTLHLFDFIIDQKKYQDDDTSFENNHAVLPELITGVTAGKLFDWQVEGMLNIARNITKMAPSGVISAKNSLFGRIKRRVPLTTIQKS